MTARSAWIPACQRCGATNPGSWTRCPACGGVQMVHPAAAGAGVDGGPGTGIWRHRAMLPPVSTEVTLEEGGTPLLPVPRLAAELGVGELAVKHEAINPTLSFKDRAMALGVSLALEFGAVGVVAASTGNTAASAAAYAARAGLPCRILCAADAASSTKLQTARAYGAQVQPVDGDFSDAHAAAAELEGSGWFPLTTTFRNPYLAEAHRTVAAELRAQLVRLPDWVLVPVGAGPLLVGMHHGFGGGSGKSAGAGPSEGAGPRMVAVQAEACAPLATAWRTGSAVVAGSPESTVAGAIADPLRGYTDEGELTLTAVRESGGQVLAVPDDEMTAARRALAGEGLLVEPASAAPLAALRRLLVDGVVGPGDSVVLLATGHGAKEGDLS